MSYADVAASGPKQTDEESKAAFGIDMHRRAPAVAEIRHDDSSVHSLIDVDSPHVSSVPSDFDSQSVQTDTQAERERLEQEARDKAEEVKEKAGLKKQQAKSKAKNAGQTLRNNSDNPVVIGNAVAITALGGILGFGAYRKYAEGSFTWRVAGLWAGAVGLFGVADYYVSQYLFKKYPTK
ncbi:hypothetical protein CAC42_4744 [Sphaceloma murrayae]|uniref:Uncharacterized protein n=1 Tax=Sphaceloma murrayae TaxID=2082308 RepID=A0A2K1QPE4_9PEZI|nr:hypothetical protein CAC42_4744 [Sphaceloma murrayae]